MTNKFEREERYIVFKISKLDDSTRHELQMVLRRIFASGGTSPLVDCVVVENDWPEYEPTWAAIEARMTGRAALSADGGEDKLDAERYRWLRELTCNSLHLTRDGDHACNYMTASDWIDTTARDFDDDDPAEVERMRAANTIWRLQIYPNTPVGFNVWHGATLDAAIDAAIAANQAKGDAQ